MIDQVTAVFVLPVTVAVNCWVWPSLRLTAGGATVTPSGTKDIVAVADRLLVSELVAVTVTDCAAVMGFGEDDVVDRGRVDS